MWARIIKNAFAPLYAKNFDYVAGNPPWINWESLPENYRQETKPLWVEQGLFPHSGMDTIIGKGKKDISMLMTHVAMQEYLKTGGKLGFVITQSVFKTAGAGQGFRRFVLGTGERIQVQHVDDMARLQPFEGASNRTSVVIIQKGLETKYPTRSYLYWKKTAKGRSLAADSTLADIIEMTERSQFVAEPVSTKDATSPWLTGRPRAVRAIRRVLGQSDYTAHEGVNTGGTNAVYWVRVIEETQDGLALVTNLTEGARRKAECVQMVVERDLLYPLLRGRDVRRWKSECSAHILMVQDTVRRRGLNEDNMKLECPKTYSYLKRFKSVLRERAAFKRYFRGTDPFSSMFDVGGYTLAAHKVVWREQASELMACVLSPTDGRIIVPDHKLMLIECKTRDEAHYVCALLGSSEANFAAVSYAVKIQFNPHLLKNIRIPTFDPASSVHGELTGLSENAHHATARGDVAGVRELEGRIDELAARVWGLSPAELTEIQESLEELG